MWAVLGFLVAAAIGLAVALPICDSRPVRLERHPWVLDETAKLHVNILGTLAGFAFTGVVLVVTFVHERTGAADISLDIVVVMLLVAFLWWVGGAFLISYLPYSETCGDLAPRVHFNLASTMEYRTVFLSWFALLPLLEANGLGRLVPIVDFLLPASLVFGSVLIAMAADGMGVMRVWETYLTAGVAGLLVLAYAAAVNFVIPGARSAYTPVHLSLVIFCVNGMGFAIAALAPLCARYAGVARFFERHGRRIVLADMQLTMLSLSFLWLGVVGII